MPYLESNAWNPECKTVLDSLAFVCTAGRRGDPGFFLGGGALVSCSTSTPINHMVFLFFLAEYQLY